MATKKTASAKKSSSTAAKQTKTKVTTVKAVAADATPKAQSRKSTALLKGRSVLLGAFIAEFIGTFILAAVAVLSQGQPLSIGFAMVAIALTIGVLSGSHVNPLITVGAWATRKISGKRALGYIFAQVLGALLAFVVASAFVGAAPKADPQAMMYGQQAAALFKVSPIPADKEFYVFFAEMLGAVIFGFTVSSAIREKRNRAAQAFTIGFGLLTALLVSGVLASYIGGSTVINPALAFTLNAVSLTSQLELWAILVYIVSPIIGGTIGFFLYDVLRGESDGGDDKLIKDEL